MSNLLLCADGAVEGRPPQPSVDVLSEAFTCRAFSVGAEGDEKHGLIDCGRVRPLPIDQYRLPKTVLQNHEINVAILQDKTLSNRTAKSQGRILISVF